MAWSASNGNTDTPPRDPSKRKNSSFFDPKKRARGANSDVWILKVGDPNNSGILQVTDSFLLRGDTSKAEEAVAWSPDDTRLLINRTGQQIVSINMGDPAYPETILLDGSQIKNATASPGLDCARDTARAVPARFQTALQMLRPSSK